MMTKAAGSSSVEYLVEISHLGKETLEAGVVGLLFARCEVIRR